MENAIALLEVQAMVTAIVGLDAMVNGVKGSLVHTASAVGTVVDQPGAVGRQLLCQRICLGVIDAKLVG